jgi:uncharacterized protein
LLDFYQLEHQGRTYFGNVSLRQFHIFCYGGQTYLANVDAFKAFPISADFADQVQRVAVSSGSLVPQALFRELQRVELVRAGEQELDAWTRDRSRPAKLVTNMTLLLAQRCNMRCVYCYGDGGEYGAKGMMCSATALQAVDWLIENSGDAEHLNICFFGGEPLLNFTVLKQAVVYAREQGAQKGKRFTFTVTTNGSVLTNEITAFLKQQDVKPMVSFDGPQEYQDRNRPFSNGRGSYARVRANVQKLRAAFADLGARGIVCGDQDPFQVRAAAAAAGFTECSIGIASPVIEKSPPSGVADGDTSRVQAVERMLAYKRQLLDEALEAIRERKVNIHCTPTMLPAIIDLCDGKRHYYGCGLGRGLAGVSISGDVYPCHRFIGQPEMKMGNIADYKAQPLNDYSRAIVDRLPECQRCWARHWCGGGCFYRNKALTGDLHRPDPLDCLERKSQIEGLLHVHAQLQDDDKAYLRTVRESILHARGVPPAPPASRFVPQPDEARAGPARAPTANRIDRLAAR